MKMTTEEFLKQLKAGQQVTFDKSKLRDPSSAMGDDLPDLLPRSASISYGIEVSRLQHGTPSWVGVQEWWLLVGSQLWQASVTVSPHDGKPALASTHRSRPLSSLQSAVVNTVRQGTTDRVYLKQASLALHFVSGPQLEVTAHYPVGDSNPIDPLSVLQFAQHLESLAPGAVHTV